MAYSHGSLFIDLSIFFIDLKTQLIWIPIILGNSKPNKRWVQRLKDKETKLSQPN